jgi:outer membrane beta-barrel protein
MTRQTLCRLFTLLTICAATFAFDSEAYAQESRETARESGSVIRHQLLYRSTRVELAPMLGMTLNDAYLRNGIVGATLSYHLTNEWGLSAVAGYGVAQLDTDLRNSVEAKLEENASDDLNQLSYSHIQWLAGLEVNYVPIVGKFSLFNSIITNYDIHLIGGFTFIGETAQSAIDGGEVDSQLEGLRPAPTVGLGTRFFLGDGISANIQLRDYLYSRSEVSTLTSDPEFKNNFMLTLGMSFFFPQEVKISR